MVCLVLPPPSDESQIYFEVVIVWSFLFFPLPRTSVCESQFVRICSGFWAYDLQCSKKKHNHNDKDDDNDKDRGEDETQDADKTLDSKLGYTQFLCTEGSFWIIWRYCNCMAWNWWEVSRWRGTANQQATKIWKEAQICRPCTTWLYFEVIQSMPNLEARWFLGRQACFFPRMRDSSMVWVNVGCWRFPVLQGFVQKSEINIHDHHHLCCMCSRDHVQRWPGHSFWPHQKRYVTIQHRFVHGKLVKWKKGAIRGIMFYHGCTVAACYSTSYGLAGWCAFMPLWSSIKASLCMIWHDKGELEGLVPNGFPKNLQTMRKPATTVTASPGCRCWVWASIMCPHWWICSRTTQLWTRSTKWPPNDLIDCIFHNIKYIM